MSEEMDVSSDKLAKFTFTEETLKSFRASNSIPIDLYDKDGKILFPKKKSPTRDDFTKLLKLELHGVYFLASELKKLTSPVRSDPKSKNTTKLFDPAKTEKFAKESAIFLERLKKESFTSSQAIFVQNSIQEILNDFTTHPEFESGIFNILEILHIAGVPLQSELMTKRTIVAMGMKVRAKNHTQGGDISPHLKEYLTIMIASYLADIGYTRLDINDESTLSPETYNVVKQHPIISYLMTLPAKEISTEVRTLILNHHRPFLGAGVNNNFPSTRSVFTKLMSIRDMYADDPSKERMVQDIEKQLYLQQHQNTNLNLDEDIAILSLASEYASLTSKQAWRPAIDASKALKMIVNNSFFLYNNRNIRLLLDYVGASLNNNENVINLGDFLITTSLDSENKSIFDLCIVIEIGRHQSRPILQRICIIKPIFKKTHKYVLADFDLTQIRMDRRKAIIDLGSQAAISQRIIYIIDHELNPKIYETANKLLRGSRK